MPRKPISKPVARAEPRVRRAYFECRFGQLHVHNAIPPGGGFEEGTPLLCLPPAPLSGRIFTGLLRAVGCDRSVYAPDIPGYGESDAPPGAPTIADGVAAIGDFLDAMRFRQIDVLGSHAGAVIATELAIERPQQIRRVVLAGVPLLPAAEREAAARSAGPQGGWAAAAGLRHPLRERLALVRQPLLVLRPKDSLWEASLRVREVLPAARIVDLPEQGEGLFETAPQAVLAALREFLA